MTQLSIRGSAASGSFEKVCQEELVDKAAPTMEEEERGDGER